MENITLLDVESNKTYDVLLSAEDAHKATTDIVFATELLNAAKHENSQLQHKQHSPDASKNTLLSSLPQTSTSMAETENTADDEEESESVYRWSPACVKLLLTNYQDMQEKFQDGKQSHKKCWEIISKKLNTEGYNVSGNQCSLKLRSLKKTYKSIEDHNAKSGNDKRTWPYFDIMDEIFSKTAWCEPVAVASSSGLSVKRQLDSSDSTSEICTKKSTTIADILKQRLLQKEQQEAARTKRHEERMAMDKNLLDILTKLVER